MQTDVGPAITNETPVSYAHVARYRYSSDVVDNDNFLRLAPYYEPHQIVQGYEITTRPYGGQVSYKDRFGNQVHRVRVSTHHRELVIAAVGRVDLVPWQLPDGDVPREIHPLIGQHMDFLGPTKLVNPDNLASFAAQLSGVTPWLVETVTSVVAWVHNNIEYRRGNTTVTTPAHEVLKLGSGVCQDQTHLAIAILRSLGTPCRYVGGIKTKQIGETHAWFEFLHPDIGWVPADCTTNVVGNTGVNLLKFAIGRDYTDTSPVSGTFVSQGKGTVDGVLNWANFNPVNQSIDDAINWFLTEQQTKKQEILP
ncbi:MAG: transglutaminase family protein [Chloroflexi bacterium]|nr:transglutaminase family protein [Chloroflexota bacterium]